MDYELITAQVGDHSCASFSLAQTLTTWQTQSFTPSQCF